MSKASAVCTFGDGPDVLVVIRSDKRYDLENHINPGEASFGLNYRDAIQLVDELNRAIDNTRDLLKGLKERRKVLR